MKSISINHFIFGTDAFLVKAHEKQQIATMNSFINTVKSDIHFSFKIIVSFEHLMRNQQIR